MNQIRILGLLTARSGSKGIPGKNLKLLIDKPLIGWAASALAQAKGVETRICSTDDPLIAEAAKSVGLKSLGLDHPSWLKITAL